MTRTLKIERWIRFSARVLAVSIALAGLIDPAITSTRRSNAIVAVVAIDPLRDSASATRVAASLATRMRVVPARFPRADASVIVGDGVPLDQEGIVSPTFAVAPDTVAPSVRIVALDAPNDASLHASIPVGADVRVRRAAGRSLTVALRVRGVLVDTVSLAVRSTDTLFHVTLHASPTERGIVQLRLSAALDDRALGAEPANAGTASAQALAPRSGLRAEADAALFVRDEPWPVLVYDPRPSWMSTFVRRALEQDARFTVTSRVVTSRDISIATGAAPARLDLASTLDAFAAIVVGAPELLTTRDVAGLEAFLRRRGGSVILLLDQRASGPVAQLMGVPVLNGRALGAPMRVGPGGSDTWLRASELAWPQSLPAEATALATVRASEPDSARRTDDRALVGRVVIWRTAVGAGQLVVSGALDAWRFRDVESSTFDRYWQALVASAASSAPPPLIVSIAATVLRPEETTEVLVSERSRVLQDGATGAQARSSLAAATIESDTGAISHRDAVRLWPDGAPGTYRATIRAPAAIGPARVVVHLDDLVGNVSFVVSPTAERVTPERADLQRAWITAHKGSIVTESQLETLADKLLQRVQVAPRRERWYPMRSPWWLIPLVAALSAEWWLRRRRGLA